MELAVITLIALACSTVMSILAFMMRRLLPLLSRARITTDPAWKPNTVLRGLKRLQLDRT
jgi:hypothetical protein